MLMNFKQLYKYISVFYVTYNLKIIVTSICFKYSNISDSSRRMDKVAGDKMIGVTTIIIISKRWSRKIP